MQYIMVMDVGSSKVRCSLVDVSDGSIPAQAAETLHWQHPQGDWVELEAADVYQATQSTCRQMVAALEELQGELRGMIFSCMGDSLVATDAEFNPLYPMILAFDGRAIEEAEQVAQSVGPERFMEITGGPNLPMLVCSKILWLKRHRPEVFRQARYFLSIQQYLSARLGLPIHTDYTLACRKSMYDIRRHAWSPEITEAAGVKISAIGAEVHPSNAVATTLSHFGGVALPRETPLFYGAHDSECGYIGLGVDPLGGDILGNVCGTYDMIGNFSPEIPAGIGKTAAEAGCGPLEQSYIISGSSISGSYLEWFRREMSPLQGEDTFEALFEAVRFDGSGTLLFLPGFERSDGRLLRMNQHTGRPDIFRAVVEGVTFRLKHMVNEMESLYTRPFDKIRCGGGGSANDQWMQFKADLMGKQVERLHTRESSSVGAAILACVGLGIYPDFQAAFARMLRVQKVFLPDPPVTQAYRLRFAEFMSEVARARGGN